MKPEYINAGIYLYRDHYIKRDAETKKWRVFPQYNDEDGISLHKCRNKKQAMYKIDCYFRSVARVVKLL